jgi:hypothetical protein
LCKGQRLEVAPVAKDLVQRNVHVKRGCHVSGRTQLDVVGASRHVERPPAQSEVLHDSNVASVYEHLSR